jgi:hypothetical protein
MNYGVIKKLVFSVLLICGMAVGSSNAFAVTGTIKITGLDANQHFSIPDLGVNGEADENGEFVTDLACNPDDDEDKTSSGQTTDSMGNPVMLLCLPNGSFFTSEELLIGGTAALGAFLVQSIDQNTIEGTPAAAIAGPYTSCVVRISGNPDSTISGGPATFTGSPFTFFGTAGHTLGLIFTAGSDPLGGWSITASGPGSCTDTFSTAGTTFPLTGSGTGGCGFTTMLIVSCI